MKRSALLLARLALAGCLPDSRAKERIVDTKLSRPSDAVVNHDHFKSGRGKSGHLFDGVHFA